MKNSSPSENVHPWGDPKRFSLQLAFSLCSFVFIYSFVVVFRGAMSHPPPPSVVGAVVHPFHRHHHYVGEKHSIPPLRDSDFLLVEYSGPSASDGGGLAAPLLRTFALFACIWPPPQKKYLPCLIESKSKHKAPQFNDLLKAQIAGGSAKSYLKNHQNCNF